MRRHEASSSAHVTSVTGQTSVKEDIHNAAALAAAGWTEHEDVSLFSAFLHVIFAVTGGLVKSL